MAMVVTFPEVPGSWIRTLIVDTWSRVNKLSDVPHRYGEDYHASERSFTSRFDGPSCYSASGTLLTASHMVLGVSNRSKTLVRQLGDWCFRQLCPVSYPQVLEHVMALTSSPSTYIRLPGWNDKA